jgi:hypothetical protein
MGQFSSHVPNIHFTVKATNVWLIKGVKESSVQGNTLTAVIDDPLTQEAYEELAKQLRLVFGFSFRNVYSESYNITTQAMGFHHTGQDESKSQILKRNYVLTPKFLESSSTIFKDLLSMAIDEKNKTKLFNMLYIWTRACELKLLHMPLEAHILLGQIVDDMVRPGPDFKQGKLMKGFGIIKTASDQFAATALLHFKRDQKPHAKDELDGFSYLYRLRQRQAETLSNETTFYLGKKATADVERKNSFLFEITRLYILWLFGLDYYHLKQNGLTYRIERSKK